MIEAKDTLTKTTEDNCHNTLEERLLEQARISLKVGRRDIFDWLESHEIVVSGIKGQEVDYYHVTPEEWQEKKKECGIE